MKRLMVMIIIGLLSLIGYGQNTNAPISDSGYYHGVVKDSLMNKHIFMKFLSNDGDNILHIVPYILRTDEDSTLIYEHYKEILEKEGEDSIDGNVFMDYGWNIPGFDNYCYYTVSKGTISFSLNIANINKQYLDVFQFNGKLSNDGKTIKSVISSTDTIFEHSVLILNYRYK